VSVLEKFRKRFDGNPYLNFPDEVEILRGIGLFHVHGHKDECYGRFAPTFIPGAGMVDGEILETLWAVLNGIADSIRSQSTSHRQETLDDHMNDSNWKKMINIIYRLCQKLKNAVPAAKDSQMDFANINDSTDPETVQRWLEEEAEAQKNRNDHEEAMDIFDLKMSKGGCPQKINL
jgi:Kyakuja-Dileera-Zisupton transposase